jgi:uncharacterized membrane protein YhaH (DUF805 family)
MTNSVCFGGRMTRKSTWIAVALAIAVLAIVIAVIASAWSGLGDTGMSAAGWAALVLGVIVTLALGVGLMALVFISNRRGFDEPGGGAR